MATNLYKAGAFATDTPSNIICLFGKITTSANVCTLRKLGAAAGYQVSTGKTFYCSQLLFTIQNPVSALESFALGYADNDCGVDTTNARTNPVSVIGTPEAGTTPLLINGFGFDPGQVNNLSEGRYWNPVTAVFPWAPASKYPYIRSTTDGNPITFIVWGFEA